VLRHLGDAIMNALVIVGIVLLALWAILSFAFHVGSELVHLILVVAATLIVWGLVRAGEAAMTRKH
jgi:hypothetical protein